MYHKSVEINWIKTQNGGFVSLYNTNITLGSAFSSIFETAYRVLVGISEQLLVIKPLSKAEAERGDLETESYKIMSHRSYSRISSTSLMTEVAKAFGLDYTHQPLRFKAEFDEKEGLLLIDIGKGGQN